VEEGAAELWGGSTVSALSMGTASLLAAGWSSPDDETLLERQHEQQVISAALGAARAGSGRLILVEGEPGIGKSALVRFALRQAVDTGMLVFFASADDVGSSSEFGTAVKLFEPVLDRLSADRRRAAFRGRARLTSQLFGGSVCDHPSGDAARRDMLCGALRALLANLVHHSQSSAETRSALVALDDAHCSDEASLRFLCHLGTYLAVMPVTVLVAARCHGPADTGALLVRLVEDRNLACRLRLRVLSAQASERLVEGSWPEAEPPLRSACADAAGGNPFYLAELIDAARSSGLSGDASGARMIAHLATESLVGSVKLRLAQLPGKAANFALAVAVLGSSATLSRAAALVRMSEESAERAAKTLVDAHVLAWDDPLRFLYPVVGSLVSASISASAGSRLHRRAAELLDAEGAAAELVVGHLLRCRPAGDPKVVDLLLGAAVKSYERGDHRASRRLLERALAEPPLPERRPLLLAQLALASASAGTADAPTLLREALPLASEPTQRARLLAALAPLEYARSNLDAAVGAAEAALADLDPADPLAGEVLTIRMAIGEGGGAEEWLGRDPTADLINVADRSGRQPGLLALAAAAGAFGGSPAAEVYESARAALAGLKDDDGFHGVITAAAVMALLFVGALDEAAEFIVVRAKEAQESDSPITRALSGHWETELRYRQGRLDDAVIAGRKTLKACEEGWDMCRPWVLPALCHAYLDRGETKLAAELLAGYDLRGDSISDLALQTTCARVHLEQGDLQSAKRRLVRVGEAAERQFLPPTVLPWRTWAAAVLLRLDDRPSARELALVQLDHARRVGAAVTLGAALRVAAVATGGEPGVELAAEAVSVLEGSVAALERAKALVDFGALLRRSGQSKASRDPLRAGGELAESLGASPLAKRAREELSAAGGRRGPRRGRSGPGVLTPGERRVADLAARGLSSPEIAHALFLSVRTVDWHLRHVYQKLGIASRRQLAGSLAASNAQS